MTTARRKRRRTQDRRRRPHKCVPPSMKPQNLMYINMEGIHPISDPHISYDSGIPSGCLKVKLQ